MKKSLFVILAVFVMVVVAVAYFWFGTLPLDSKNNNQVRFVVKNGEGLNSITKRLYDEKIIKTKLSFYLKIKQLRLDQKIQAGSYLLSPSQSAQEIALALTKGTNDEWVTIIEGLRKEEVAQILQKKLNINPETFLAGAIEGKLFPDTYLVPKDYSAAQMLDLLYKTHAKKIASLQSSIAKSGLSESEVLILASIVQKEAKKYSDMVQVASVLKKRMASDWALEVDATLQYALGYQNEDKTWWKQYLTAQDLQLESLYNTRKRKGLPPTPICSPGLDAIRAVILSPSETPFWFYISNADGTEMHFATTLEEHNANIDKYLR